MSKRSSLAQNSSTRNVRQRRENPIRVHTNSSSSECETFKVLLKLCATFSDLKMPVGLVLTHQLYAEIASRTQVDRELNDLRMSRKIRLLHVSNRNLSDQAVVLSNSYESLINNLVVRERSRLTKNKASSKVYRTVGHQDKLRNEVNERVLVLEAFLDFQSNSTALKTSRIKLTQYLGFLTYNGGVFKSDNTQPIVEHLLPPESLAERKKKLELGDHRIRQLVQYGLLKRGIGDDDLWFSVPKIGRFLCAVLGGREELLKMIKRTKYKEMLERKLIERQLKCSFLPMNWHILDARGCGAVRCTSTPAGKLLQLKK